MRKHQQQQIIEIIQTIKEAQSAGLYADARDGALAVSGYIDRIEGEGTRTAALLEEYRNLLFKASQGEVGEKLLRKHLIKVDNAVRDELAPNRIEIAFLSYNASMADSIESIYLAAKADPDCDAYWIPIPYYERRNDGSFGKMHYEGAECYGDNIECVDWQQYDIEARHPDVIVTFAPYDSGNYVTSVHPDFYCERLRGLTDLLLYVPYFVAVDDIQEHFATVAGCVYAHVVIVQSEKIRDSYIRLFKEAYGNRFGRPDEKFVALGSPKYDKVINTKREDCELPGAWRELIGDKKVIFYNTSVSAILAGNERYLKKLRSVLDAFKKRDDVVLWWRPHPLNEATVKSMRPQLLDEYERIVAEYKQNCYGIYDGDTSGLNRAIAYSDAYYGDMSSLVALYSVTGKPIMLQNVSMSRQNNRYLTPQFHFICESVSAYWSVPTNFNSLFKIEKETLRCEFIGTIPGASVFTERSFGNILCVSECLYLTPHGVNAIIKYDIRFGIFTSIYLDGYVSVSDKNAIGFWDSVLVGDKIALIPYRCDKLLIFNTNTKEVTTHIEPVNFLKHTSKGKQLVRYFNGACIIGSCLWMVSADSNIIVVFDISSESCKVIEIEDAECGFTNICFDGYDIWTVDRKAEIYCINAENNEVKQTHSTLKNIVKTFEEKLKACFIVNANDTLLLLFRYLQKAVFVDKSSGIASEILNFTNNERCDSDGEYFIYPNAIGDKILINLYNEGSLIEYNTIEKTTNKTFLSLSEHCKQALKGLFETNRETLYERYSFSLTNWLEYVTISNSITNDNLFCDNFGTKIFKYAKRKVL